LKSREEISEYKKQWRLKNIDRLKKEAHERYMRNRVLVRQERTKEELRLARIESWRKYNQKPIAKYTFQRNSARLRNIPWELTFETWWKMWEDSGKWEERGQSSTSYCMCRKGDVGPYSTTNCYIGLVSINAKEPRLRERAKRGLTAECSFGPNKFDLEELKL